MIERFAPMAAFMPVLAVFAALLIFEPSLGIPVETAQGIVVALACAVYLFSAGLWLFWGTVGIPRSPLFIGFSGLFFASLISLFVNGNYTIGLFGRGFEFGTVSFFLLAATVAHAASMMASSDIGRLLKVGAAVVLCAIALCVVFRRADVFQLPTPANPPGSSFIVPYRILSAAPLKSLLGVGPNLYSHAHDSQRYEAFNYVPQWNEPVDVAATSALTIVVMMGAFGLAAFLCLTVAPLYTVFVVPKLDVAVFASAAMATIPFALAYFFPISDAAFFLSAIGTGFLARLTSDGMIASGKRFVRYSASALILAAACILAVSGCRQLIAAHSYAVGVSTLRAGDMVSIENASDALRRADRYWSDINYKSALVRAIITKMNAMAAGSEGSFNKEEMGKLAEEASRIAHSAALMDQTDYVAWRNFASTQVTLAVGGFSTNLPEAHAAIEHAQKLAPTRPDIYVIAAQLALAEGDKKGALKNVSKALELKTDYADALALRDQLVSDK